MTASSFQSLDELACDMAESRLQPLEVPMNPRPKSISVDLDEHWSQVQRLLHGEFDDTAYRTWLAPLNLIGLEGDRVLLGVPTRFLRDWVTAHYADRIRALWRCVSPGIQGVAFVIKPVGAVQAAKPCQSRPALLGPAPNPCEAVVEPINGDISAPVDPRFTFENFVVGKSNNLAFAAAEKVAELEVAPFNPLFIYGRVGLGKTHLMHAIAWQIRRQNPRRRVVYLSAEKFTYLFVKACRFNDTMTFKEQLRSTDVLMVDDVQFMDGKEGTQEEFFHTFNALTDRGRQIVISADRNPSELTGLEERIRSRLGWGLVADVQPTTYELRLGILQSKARDLAREVKLPDSVLAFMAHRITSSVRELEGALNRVIAQAILMGHTITLDVAQELLQDLLRAHERRVTIEDIQKLVTQHYGIKITDMHSARRARVVARPRQVAMYLAKQLTPRSLPEIGRKFGGRDHTTVMHAIRRIEELRATDPVLCEDIESLRRLLKG